MLALHRNEASRTAAGLALGATVVVEIVLLAILAFSGPKNGGTFLARAGSLVACAIAVVAEASVLWVVVGRDRAANPARRALLCLIVAGLTDLFAFVKLKTHSSELASLIAMSAANAAVMAIAILIAIGLVSLYLMIAGPITGRRTSPPKTHRSP